MKRNLLLLLMGLSLSSCQKEEIINDNSNEKLNSVQIKGFEYPLDSIMVEFGKGLGKDTCEFSFDSSLEVFILKGYDGSISPDTYLNLKD